MDFNVRPRGDTWFRTPMFERHRRSSAVLALTVSASAWSSGSAVAQSFTQEATEQFGTTATKVTSGGATTPPDDGGKPSFVVLPIPQSNPAIGTGVTLVGAALYNPNQSKRPWLTGAGLMATSNGSRAFGVAQQASFWNDRFRVVAAFGKADLKLRFYGIGSGAGATGISVPTEDSGAFGLLQGMWGVTESLFVGLRVQDLRVKTTMDLTDLGSSLGINLPSIDLDHRSTLIGPSVDYDTRDSQFAPAQGSYATLRIGFASPSFGSDVSYRSLHASYSQYWSLSPRVVVAGRVSACAVDGHVPFTELCLFGTSNDLRGYTGGQYRDRDMYAAQAEVRWRFAERFGLVAFAGVGSVANTFAELASGRQLPAGGVGVRWLASKKYDVNVSADIATGRDGNAVYFYIGESF